MVLREARDLVVSSATVIALLVGTAAFVYGLRSGIGWIAGPPPPEAPGRVCERDDDGTPERPQADVAIPCLAGTWSRRPVTENTTFMCTMTQARLNGDGTSLRRCFGLSYRASSKRKFWMERRPLRSFAPQTR
jgi:hypothetical protein